MTFGDPFQGAKIKGYNGPILTYCNPGDLVCSRNLIVTKPHMSFAGARTDQAAKDIKSILEQIEKTSNDTDEAS